MPILRQLHHIFTVRQTFSESLCYGLKMSYVVAVCRRGVFENPAFPEKVNFSLKQLLNNLARFVSTENTQETFIFCLFLFFKRLQRAKTRLYQIIVALFAAMKSQTKRCQKVTKVKIFICVHDVTVRKP